MAVVTYNNILKSFEDISTAHKQVNTHGCGSEWDIATSGTVNYPMCWVVPTDSSLTGKIYNSNFTLIFMDLVHKDVRDVDEVTSDMELIAQDYIAQLLDPQYDFDFKADNIPFRRFEDRFDDEVAGVAIDITIRTTYVYDRCAIPAGSITIINR